MKKVGFSLGNGASRELVDLDALRRRIPGVIYGCNALYREWTPDALVATDSRMVNEINEAGYQGRTIFPKAPQEIAGVFDDQRFAIPVTKSPAAAVRIRDEWLMVDSRDGREYLRPLAWKKSFRPEAGKMNPVRRFTICSGPISCAMLVDIEGCTDIVLVGHDLIPDSNVYAGTRNYNGGGDAKWAAACAIELRRVIERYPEVRFYRMIPDDHYLRGELEGLPNLKHFTLMDRYREMFQ